MHVCPSLPYRLTLLTVSLSRPQASITIRKLSMGETLAGLQVSGRCWQAYK